MHCPRCNHTDTRVIDSRMSKNGLSIRRRRQCQACEYRFNTLEEILREGLVVIKGDKRREDFDRSKLLNGIRKACEKRPIDIEQLHMLISDVLVELESKYANEIPNTAIGEAVMKRLKDIDHIAYVRFASVYKDFRDIDELAHEISALKKKQ